MFSFWLSLVIFLGLVEVTTVNLVSIWFVISGLVALGLSFIIDDFLVQFAVFVVLGIILLLTTRKALTKIVTKTEKTNLDRVVGMKAVVTEDISEEVVGEVKVDGKRWSAVSEQNFKKGDFVKVLEINGVKLKVESWEE